MGWKGRASNPQACLGLPALLQERLAGCDPKCDMLPEPSFEDIAVCEGPQPTAPEPNDRPRAASHESRYPHLLGRGQGQEQGRAKLVGKCDIGVQACREEIARETAYRPRFRMEPSPERAWQPTDGVQKLAGPAQLESFEVLQLQDLGDNAAESRWHVADRVP